MSIRQAITVRALQLATSALAGHDLAVMATRKKSTSKTHYGFTVDVVAAQDGDSEVFVPTLTNEHGEVITLEPCRWELEARAAAIDECLRLQPVEYREATVTARGGFLPAVFEYETESSPIMRQVAYSFPVCNSETEALAVAQQYIEVRRYKHEQEYDLRRQARAEYAQRMKAINEQRAEIKEKQEELSAQLKSLKIRAEKLHNDFLNPTAQLELSLEKRPRLPPRRNSSRAPAVH